MTLHQARVGEDTLESLRRLLDRTNSVIEASRRARIGAAGVEKIEAYFRRNPAALEAQKARNEKLLAGIHDIRRIRHAAPDGGGAS